MTARPFLVDADVADVARRTGSTAVHLAVAHDAAADAGADLDYQKVGERALQAPEFAERHQVDVVVDEDGCGIVFAQVVADREAVPCRHQRRVDQLTVLEVDRTRHADADADHLFGAAGASGEQLAHQGAHAGQQDAGAVAHIGRLGVVRHHSEVGPQHGDVDAGRADVDADEHAERDVQLKVLCAAAAGGFLQSRLGEQTLIDEPGDQRIGFAFGKAKALRHAMARTAGRPKGRLQQLHLVSGECAPTCQALYLHVSLRRS